MYVKSLLGTKIIRASGSYFPTSIFYYCINYYVLLWTDTNYVSIPVRNILNQDSRYLSLPRNPGYRIGSCHYRHGTRQDSRFWTFFYPFLNQIRNQVCEETMSKTRIKSKANRIEEKSSKYSTTCINNKYVPIRVLFQAYKLENLRLNIYPSKLNSLRKPIEIFPFLTFHRSSFLFFP